ncbi:MAG: hypothetical protein ACR2KX_20405 [Chitinophagaceae bacterium]
MYVWICYINRASATNYYFSTASGDDSRTFAEAGNPHIPWHTIHKLNSIFSTLNAGDSILFNKGETFDGSIIINKSGTVNHTIVISAYGIGDKPIINGFRTLSLWTSIGEGIYQAYFSSFDKRMNIITNNNVPYAMGRYPNSNAVNKGWLTIRSHVANTSITGNALPFDFTGADVAIRKTRWIIDKNHIAKQSGGTINYISPTSYIPIDGYGYFVQNHIRTLDQFGEWCYNDSPKKLLFISDIRIHHHLVYA